MSATLAHEPVRAKEAASRRVRRTSREAQVLDAQLNVRINAADKEAGDAAFEAAGLHSSDVIRAVYAKAASMGDRLRTIDDLLGDGNARAQEERQSRRAAFERSGRIFDEVLAQYGIAGAVDPAAFDPMTAEEVEEAAYQDFIVGDAL